MSKMDAAAYDIQNRPGHLDEIAMALDHHDGDVRATIRTLLDDCKFLQEQLAFTQIGTSIGFTRGWTPSYDRH